MIKAVVQCGLTVAVGAGTVLGATAGSANAATMCNSNFRGDRVCIAVVDGQIQATGDDSPNSTVFLTIYDNTTGRVVVGPVGDTTVRASLPPGQYYADYYVQSNLPEAVGAQVDSPMVSM